MVAVPLFTFNVAAFRVQFPQFANPTVFPDITLQAYWDTASQYIANQSQEGFCGGMTDAQLLLALNLMTAHLAALSVIMANGSGQTPGLVQSATIDKVTVSLTPPPVTDQFQWWLSLTPYGQQLLALLQVQSVGGFYVGGAPESLGMYRPLGGC